MSRRAKLLWCLGGFGVLLLLREAGAFDWSLYRSRSTATSTMATTYGGNPVGIRLAGFDDRVPLEAARALVLSETKPLTLHYARYVSCPLLRWLPLYKTGETVIQESFSVTSDDKTLLAGKRVQRISLTVVGSVSARGYVHLATAKALDSLRTDLKPEIEKAEAAIAARSAR